MPKGNPEAYRKIDEFLASLSPDELTYAYGAVEKMAEAGGETDMEDDMSSEMPAEMPMDESAAPSEEYDLKKMEEDM